MTDTITIESEDMTLSNGGDSEFSIDAVLSHGQRNAFLDRSLLADDSRALTFVASTSGMKRDGIDLKIEGIETENFETNPVFLWAHDYSGRTLPIGKVTKLRKMKNRIDATVEFDESDEFAMTVERKYRDGFLNAVSIGWNILEWERGADGTDEADFIVTRSDLLDVSAVPVPGDPTALLKSQRAFLEELGHELIDATDQELVDGTARVVVDASPEEPVIEEITLGDALARIDEAVEAVNNIAALFRDAFDEELDEELDDEQVIDDGVAVTALVRLRDSLNKENS